MYKTLSILIPVMFFAMLLGPVASEAEAGLSYGQPAGCNAIKGGAGICWGTLRGFRQSPSTGAYANFYAGYDSNGLRTRTFSAQFNGKDFGCTVVDHLMPEDVWAQLMVNPDLHFTIEWTGDFACRLTNVSAVSYDL